VREVSLGTILKAAIIAGLLAGLTVSVFHLVVTEPLIDQAIAMEEQQAHEAGGASGHDEEPIVSRRVQKGGLVLGYLLYGLTWALPFGVVFQIARRWLPDTSGVRQGLLVAFFAYWSVCLLPFLKYPANPPGVGDPDTIGYRQMLYLGFLALSVGVTALSIGLGRYVARSRGARPGPWIPMGVCLAVLSVVLYLLMPSNPDEVTMPADLVQSFRALSLVGLTLFWVVLGFLFGKLLSRGSALAV
jgi:predicted cobalt transporter CbtA